MYFIISNEHENILVHKHFNLTGLSYIFQFADLKIIPNFYCTGCWIRQVIVPLDAKINYGSGKRWSSDKIIMGDRFPLYSLKTIKKFNLNITSDYIDQVCKNGNVDILEWWKNSGLELKYNEWVLNGASWYGQVEVLEWLKNSGLKLKYNELALDWASRNGKVDVLEWWKNSGLELKYDAWALDSASRDGKVDVLEWWKNSGLELKYNESTLDWASTYGKVEVLKWWKNSGLEIKIH
jgi:hypothetical protein